ncbi:hypothetical protein B808_1153 [Fructilactobacillus florum 8D]|uniref:Uncharacterized protein n=2 Tax=Fructilactobacillus florum TaxID=640331 RepID=W9EK38_9LACO|nr:hypothetical protein [Fructilactobacillus florum]EKK20265.1 hypothetical protein B807_903 [Fructilactobacillus florum 2F]ETO40044.1 hypothetical protein B808_1153 [Fructilactobacillus florum 8D]KRM91702.1 hypothetical protein FC87_GL000839 [Fructilactobacillus florum DSM 22689 = JCM 16035]
MTRVYAKDIKSSTTNEEKIKIIFTDKFKNDVFNSELTRDRNFSVISDSNMDKLVCKINKHFKDQEIYLLLRNVTYDSDRLYFQSQMFISDKTTIDTNEYVDWLTTKRDEYSRQRESRLILSGENVINKNIINYGAFVPREYWFKPLDFN